MIHRFHVTRATLPECVELLASHLHCAYEIEAVPCAGAGLTELMMPVTLDIRDVPLSRLMDQLSGANRSYVCWFEQGSIRLYPNRAAYDTTWLMARTVPAFKAVGIDLSAGMAKVNQVLSAAGPEFRFIQQGLPAIKDINGDTILLDLEWNKLPLRDVIDNFSFKFNYSWELVPYASERDLRFRMGNDIPVAPALEKESEVVL